MAPFSGTSGAISPKILLGHSFPTAHPSSFFSKSIQFSERYTQKCLLRSLQCQCEVYKLLTRANSILRHADFHAALRNSPFATENLELPVFATFISNSGFVGLLFSFTMYKTIKSCCCKLWFCALAPSSKLNTRYCVLIVVFLRATAYAVSEHMLSQFRLSIRSSVCHTGGSVKNG